jgi:hypothetical protein
MSARVSVSGFRDCRFSGILFGAVFRGDYLIPSQRELAGEPKDPGLHGVSFKNAQLVLVQFSEGCALENIELPANGSAFLCSVSDLLRYHHSLSPDSPEKHLLDRHFKITLPGLRGQAMDLVSKNDLLRRGEPELAAALYDEIKANLAVGG